MVLNYFADEFISFFMFWAICIFLKKSFLPNDKIKIFLYIYIFSKIFLSVHLYLISGIVSFDVDCDLGLEFNNSLHCSGAIY